jgi:hypothetical protein
LIFMPPRHCFAALLFALALAPSAALADPSDADRATARALAAEAQDAFEKKDFTTALDRFSRADAIVHAPTLMLAMARSQAGLGRFIAAQETLNRIVREGVPPKSPPSWAIAVSDAKKEIGAIGARTPSVIITVKGGAAASVTIDGAPVPSAALGVKRPVDPGKHAIRAEAPPLVAEVNVDIAEGRSEKVTLELKPPVAAPPPVVAPPPETTPVKPPVETPKPVLQPEKGSDSAVAPPVAGSPRKTIGIVALAVGGAGLVMGGVTGGLAIAKHGALSDACSGGHCPIGQQSSVDSYHLLGALSTAGFIAGGACVAAGTILILTAPRAKPAKEARVTPIVGLGYIGAQGAF